MKGGTPAGYAAQQGSAYGFKLENFLNMWACPAGSRLTASPPMT